MAKSIHKGKPHKYGKVLPRKKEGSSWTIFKCFIPGCNHYLHGEVMVQGRESICWLCGESFIMTDKNLVTKPECAPCRGDSAPGHTDLMVSPESLENE